MGIEGIGARVARKEDKRFITGAGRYVDDMVVPGMKHAAFVRSPHAHAEIKKIDVAKAKAMPGVIGVLTGQELKADGIGNLICGWMIHSKDGTPMKMGAWSPLAVDRVRYVGDAVAIVVADTKGQARDAAEAVEVTYKEMPAVTDAVEGAGARRAAAPSRGRGQSDLRLGARRRRRRPTRRSPTAAHVDEHATSSTTGWCRTRWSRAPRSATTTRREDHYTCWTTSQNPHVARLVMSAFYNVAPENKLRVIAPDVGGGFGSKIFIYPEEIVCLWASKKTGVPVKWVADRTESFLTDAHGRDHHSTRRDGVRQGQQDHRPEGRHDRQSRRLHVAVLVLGADLSLRDAAVGPVRHPGDPRQCARGLHQHRAGRCLSRGRAAGSDLSPRAHDGDGGARTRRFAGGTPAQELHHRPSRTRRRSSCATTPATTQPRSTRR